MHGIVAWFTSSPKARHIVLVAIIVFGGGLPVAAQTVTAAKPQRTASMAKEMEEQKKYRAARSRIISILESDSGKYTIDSITRKLKEEALDVNFGIVANVVTDLRSAGLVRKHESNTCMGLMISQTENVLPFWVNINAIEQLV